MKKLMLILVGVALTVGVLATAGFVYAQVDEPPETPEATEAPEFPFGRAGISRGRGMHGGPGLEMVGHGYFFGNDDGPLHEYLFPAIAKAFGLSKAQVEAFQLARETMQGIRQNLSVEEVRETMQQAMKTAIDSALADGAITQEQANEYLNRMEQMEARGFSRSFQPQGEGLLRQYMETALADALGVSLEELQSMKEDGLNLKDYADEQGWSDDELKDFLTGVYTNAIHAALEDEAITQDQADSLLERLENYDGRLPFGPGFRGPRGHWNSEE